MSDDIKMMTYADAAGALGVKVDSVKRRARNRGWKRIKGNDGLVLIGVPIEALALSEKDNPPDHPPDNRGDLLRLEKQLSAFETEVKMLRERQDDLLRDRDHWRALASRKWWHFR